MTDRDEPEACPDCEVPAQETPVGWVCPDCDRWLASLDSRGVDG